MEDLMSGGNGLLECLAGYGRLALGMGTRGLSLHSGASRLDWVHFRRVDWCTSENLPRSEPHRGLFPRFEKLFLVGNGSVLVWSWETLCCEGAKTLPRSLRLARCGLFLSCLSRNRTTLKLNPVDGVKWLLLAQHP